MFFKTRHLLKSSLILAGLSLSACAIQDYSPPQEGIELHRIEAVADFSFRNGATHLTGAQQNRLRGFLQQRKAGPSDRIIVSVPPAATPALTAQREAHLRSIIAPFNVPVRIQGDPPVAKIAEPRTRGLLRFMRASHMKVYCESEEDIALRCAQRRNLAEMLQEPGDLVQPRAFAGPFVPRKPTKAADTPTATLSPSITKPGG